jgi:hypothetical protein
LRLVIDQRTLTRGEQRHSVGCLPQQLDLLGALLTAAQMAREAVELPALELAQHVQRRIGRA